MAIGQKIGQTLVVHPMQRGQVEREGNICTLSVHFTIHRHKNESADRTLTSVSFHVDKIFVKTDHVKINTSWLIIHPE